MYTAKAARKSDWWAMMLFAVAATSPPTINPPASPSCATIPPMMVARNNAPPTLAFVRGDISPARGADIMLSPNELGASPGALWLGSVPAMSRAPSTSTGGLTRSRGSGKLEDIAGLALQRLTDRLECGEADGPRLSRLEDRQIGESDVHLLRELCERQATVVENVVEVDLDRHQTVPSRSSRIMVPCSNTCASTNSINTVSHRVRLKLQPMSSGRAGVETDPAIAAIAACNTSSPSTAHAISFNRFAFS